jgi:hypothetical protein
VEVNEFTEKHDKEREMRMGTPHERVTGSEKEAEKAVAVNELERNES